MNHFQRNLDINKLLILLLIVPGVGFAAESEEIEDYLCVPSYSTGFVFEESGKWVPAEFNISGNKYLMKKKKTGWVWEFPDRPSSSGIACVNKYYTYLECNEFIYQIQMNRDTLRFQIIQLMGYVNVAPEVEGKMTPSFTIGTCSRL